jgi:hypothetical protein
MPLPDEGLIHAWLDGELDADERARIEALIASDPAWSAAAAEARGFVAASSRIVRALDRVPANVVPAPSPRMATGRSRWWMTRAAALLLVVAGAAVVWRRNPPELPAGTTTVTNGTTTVTTVPRTKKQEQPSKPPVAAAEPGPRRDAGRAAPVVRPRSAPSAVPNPVPMTGTNTPPSTAAMADARTAPTAPPPMEPSRDALAVKKDVADSAALLLKDLRAAAPRLDAPVASGAVAQSTPRSGTAANVIREERAKAMAAERCFIAYDAGSDSTRVLRFDARALTDSIKSGWVFRSDSVLVRARDRAQLRVIACPSRTPDDQSASSITSPADSPRPAAPAKR